MQPAPGNPCKHGAHSPPTLQSPANLGPHWAQSEARRSMFEAVHTGATLGSLLGYGGALPAESPGPPQMRIILPRHDLLGRKGGQSLKGEGP